MNRDKENDLSDEELKNTENATLSVHYCSICGKMVFILKDDFKKLPKRKSDRSTVIDESTVLAKNYLKREKQVIIKRKYGYEKQWRRICQECESPLGYQTRPYEDKGKSGYYLYIYPKGVVSSVGDCRVAKEIAKLAAEKKVKQA